MIDLSDKGYYKSNSNRLEPYHEYKNTWYKVTREPELLCRTNEKIQISVTETLFKEEYKSGVHYEMNLIHEYPDQVWAHILLYSLEKSDIENRLEELENRLLKMWINGQ